MNIADDFEIKDFMESEEIPASGNEHDRICAIFQGAGATVFYVQCSAYDPIWSVCIGGFELNREYYTAYQRAIRRVLLGAGIRLDHDEPALIRKNKRVNVVFIHNRGERGKRIIYTRTAQRTAVCCREVLVLTPPL